MRLFLFAVAMLTVTGALAAWGGFDSDFDTQAKPWHEIQARLPPFPKMDRLLPFQVSPATRNRYFIDPASVSVGEDGVVRYTVVIQAAGGAENVSFEGMRCKTGEGKLYAFGHTDGQWSRNRYARWEPIPMRQATSYQRVLFKHYFCALEGRHDLHGLLDNLKQGGQYGE
jgi:hypothetical protein